MPQFIDTSMPQWPQYATIGVVFAGIDFAVMFAYAALGAHAIRLLRRRAVLWMDRCCGAALLVLSGSLLFYRRSAA
jgi:threonine/homoserine/homoserine lactone efflux protein